MTEPAESKSLYANIYKIHEGLGKPKHFIWNV